MLKFDHMFVFPMAKQTTNLTNQWLMFFGSHSFAHPIWKTNYQDQDLIGTASYDGYVKVDRKMKSRYFWESGDERRNIVR